MSYSPIGRFRSKADLPVFGKAGFPFPGTGTLGLIKGFRTGSPPHTERIEMSGIFLFGNIYRWLAR